jgi:NADP-dependent 3-hydroxy acid dehydrogenase YdfG
MTQALLRGTVGTAVNSSSIGGQVAVAAPVAYAGSKFAPDAIGEALRREAAQR